MVFMWILMHFDGTDSVPVGAYWTWGEAENEKYKATDELPDSESAGYYWIKEAPIGARDRGVVSPWRSIILQRQEEA